MSLLGRKGLRKLVHGRQAASEWISNENKKEEGRRKAVRTKVPKLKYKARKQQKKTFKKRSKGMIIKRGSRLKGQLRRRAKSRGNSATPTRGELTKAILLVYRRDWWNCACVSIALNTISKEFAKNSYGLLCFLLLSIPLANRG